MELLVMDKLIRGGELDELDRACGGKVLDRRFAAACRREPSRRNLKQEADLKQVVDGHLLRLHQEVETSAERFGDPPAARPCDKAAAGGSLRGADQVLSRAEAQRLPDRGTADAELFGQLALGRQPRTWQQLPAQDHGPPLARKVLVDLRSACRGPTYV